MLIFGDGQGLFVDCGVFKILAMKLQIHGSAVVEMSYISLVCTIYTLSLPSSRD
jgi:hypothetical protein